MSGNCTGQGNVSCSPTETPYGSTTLFFPLVNIISYSIVYGIISVVALAGNLMVCYVIIKNPDMRTVTNSLLVNLAVADILFTLVTVPPLLATEISLQWFLGSFMCKAVPVVSMTTTAVSIYTMVILAVDRYHAIIKPFEARAHHTTKRTLALITTTWLLSFAIAIPQAPARVIRPDGFCWEDWAELGGKLGSQIYGVVTFALLFVVPICVITVSYVRILTRLSQREEVLSSVCNLSAVNYTEPRASNTTPAQRAEQKTLTKSKRRTTTMLLVVIIAFLVCNTPFYILLLVTSFLHAVNEAIFLTASIMTVLMVCSSACNPFIYNFFSEKFRIAFRQAFKCGRERRNEDAASLSTVLNLQ